jgi:NosR/NirI family nitrous oxide reductase transcriptional regulator
MPAWWTRYARWLHLSWPAGRVEKLPRVGVDGSTRIPGVFVVGDLLGTPLLKFALDSGARSVETLAREAASRSGSDEALDLVIVGAGVSGIAAAAEARRLGLAFAIVEGARPLATLHDFPRGKPIYTYPRGMRPAGAVTVSAGVKEALI